MSQPCLRQRAIAWLSLLLAAVPAAALDLAEIKGKGVLRVLVMPDTRRPEFYSVKPGAPPGFDAEVLDHFAALHKLRLEVVAQPGWDALIPALQARKGELIAGRFTATDVRKKVISFTNEVFPTRNVVINRKPNKPIATLGQLKDEKIGTNKGSSMAEAIAAAGIPATSVDDSVPPGAYGEALKSGKITAAVWGVESAIALQREDPEIQLGMFLGPPASLAYAVRRDEPELLKALNEYIDNLRRTQTWNRLVVKYFGAAAPEILRKARAE
jgi:ABC-type amino acid transport substrate-binding protein